MRFIKDIKRLSIMVFAWLFLLTGCCGGRYNYYNYRKKGEEALIAKNYKKAQSYYSTIYTNESKKPNADIEKTRWAFYRLGVIAEVTGNLKMAKGYYWGDAIDEGFYEESKLTSWLAQAGWDQVEECNEPRTLEEILELESAEPPEEGDFTERKKDIIIPNKNKDVSKLNKNPNKKGIITRTVNKSRIRPRRNAPEPMKVLY
jgi:ribosomal protein S12